MHRPLMASGIRQGLQVDRTLRQKVTAIDQAYCIT